MTNTVKARHLQTGDVVQHDGSAWRVVSNRADGKRARIIIMRQLVDGEWLVSYQRVPNAKPFTIKEVSW